MKNTYLHLLQQTYKFPQAGFDVHQNTLQFHGVDLQALIEKYGTPFKLTYLPKVGEQIQRMQTLFAQAMQKHHYNGQYYYCYCTKSNHFHHVVQRVLGESNVHLETSSAFDIDLIERLYERGEIDKDTLLLHNGYKTADYLRKIRGLLEAGHQNSMTILDSVQELERLEQVTAGISFPLKIGLRLATNREAQAAHFTSRLGIPEEELLTLFEEQLQNHPTMQLTMLHFFVDAGIRDSIHYWQELRRVLNVYTQLKPQAPNLTALNLGGGMPIRNHLGFDYDYQYMVEAIVKEVKTACQEAGVPVPDLFTEFGKYTVGEAGAIIFEVLEEKRQNDLETWYIVNNSLMNTIPDAWSILEKFILLPINGWQQPYQRVSVGGISCDPSDYYNSEDFNQELLLPHLEASGGVPLYIGFFHTGAYQDAISGYGGIKHCLIPSPKHIVVERNAAGELVDYVYRPEQSAEDMFRILGY